MALFFHGIAIVQYALYCTLYPLSLKPQCVLGLWCLGERNLYAFSETGQLFYMKKFDYNPSCFLPYFSGWLSVLINKKSKDSPSNPSSVGGGGGSGRFCARNFSVCPAFDDSAYLLSVVALPSLPPKLGQLPIMAKLTVECPRNRTRLARLRVQGLDHYTKRLGVEQQKNIVAL